MIRQNLHTHCKWDDGENTVEEMIAAAKQAGLTSLGISVHTPVPYSSQSCPASSFSAYLQEMNTLKEKYAQLGFQLFTGIEWDVLSSKEYGQPTPDFASFDYVIGSVHAIPVKRRLESDSPIILELLKMMGDAGFDYPVVDESIKKTKYMVRDLFGKSGDAADKSGDAADKSGDAADKSGDAADKSGDAADKRGDAAAEAYFAQYKNIADNEHVKIVGHFDLLKKFCHQYPYYDDKEYHVFNENSVRYHKAAIDALDLLLAKDKIIELNTSLPYIVTSENKTQCSPYPSRKFLEHILKKHGRVTVSSDAHRAQDVAREFKTAEAILRDLNFKEIWVLQSTDQGIQFMPQALK